MKKLLKVVLLSLVLTNVYAKNITDMLGNEVKVPESSERVFSAAPPMTVLLYSLAPEKMIGVNYKFMPTEEKYMLKSIKKLPVLGSFFSSSGQANFEKVMALKPDIIFMWDITKKRAKFFETELAKLKVPLAYIQQNSIEQTKDALLKMASYIGKEKRAKKLVKYADYNLDRVKKSVAKLKEGQKKRVFLSDGANGLKTRCDKDIHAEIIRYSGGVNVYKCENGASKKATITLEQLYKYDPDVIFVWNPKFFKSLDENSPWRNLRAFKNKQIYFAPMSPFNWLSRPPSLMRFIGTVWMHNKLYPEHFKVDMTKEIQDFYKLFLHVSLSKDDVTKLLKGQ